MRPEPKRRGPSRAQVYRRRIIALLAFGGAVAIAVVAVNAALPHVHHERALPPPPRPPKPFRIIFPEGFTRAQMADRVAAVARIARRKTTKRVRLSRAVYVRASRTATIPCFKPKRRRNLEGFLFPATYDFLPATTSVRLVHAQLQAFCRNWRGVSLRYPSSKNLTPYDVLIIASMVEKETIAPEERRLVAAVVYNRLHAHMPLGIDATLRYGLHIPATQSIRESQLASSSPYNSRKRVGLPPTPIANPGLASIKAAADPARVDYLFFVRKPDKRHHFFTASERAFARYECAHGYGC